MKTIKRHLKINGKLTLWAASILLILFIIYTMLQYFLVQNWIMAHEKSSLQKRMDEVLAYIKESDAATNISERQTYLKVLNDQDQMIRLIREDGRTEFTITNGIPPKWIPATFVTRSEVIEKKITSETVLIYRKPFTVGKFRGTVEIIRNVEGFDSLIDQLLVLVVSTGVVAILLSFVGGRIIAFQLLKPIKTMIQSLKQIKSEGIDKRIPISEQKDEISELGIVFNDLMTDIEKSFTQQKQFVEDASHELKTPLSVIHGHLSLINRWGKENPQVLERSIALSLNETNRLIRLVSDLVIISRVDETVSISKSLSSEELSDSLQNIVENFKLLHKDAGFSISRAFKNHFHVNISKHHLEQVVVILLDNAIKYSKEEINIKIRVFTANDQLVIEVKDEGLGIPKKELPYVLDRFYRVDKARSRKHGGSGLGLSIAHVLITQYKGTLGIESVFNEWTKVSLSLPLEKEE